MRYFLDTEFLEGTQKKWFGETKPIIDLISIGIVCEDGREYYAISKDFNLKEAWNRYDWKRKTVNDGIPGAYKEYWIRDNVLKPIFYEMYGKDINFHNIDKYFTYKEFKKLINKYGKTNKQIAEEIINFCAAEKTIWETDGLGQLAINRLMDNPVEFYGYYSDYDWVVFCWLFGKMNNLPKGFPMYCIDLKQELDNKLKVTNIESKLWDLLDNIDSASDMFKPNNEDKYVQYIYSKLKHSDLLKCDGYNIISKYKTIEEIQALPNYPKQTNEHNALSDARFNYELYKFLNTL